MSDPVAEAAQRACRGEVSHLIGPGRYALRGAREMAEPIRELHRHRHLYQTLDEFLADLVPLIYTSEEMQS